MLHLVSSSPPMKTRKRVSLPLHRHGIELPTQRSLPIRGAVCVYEIKEKKAYSDLFNACELYFTLHAFGSEEGNDGLVHLFTQRNLRQS